MKKSNYLIILILLTSSIFFGQGSQPAIDETEKKTVIDSVCANLEREYIFPEITQKYVSKLKENLRSGKYTSIKEPQEYAKKLTEDLAAIHRDGHLHINYNPEWIKNEKQRAKLDEAAILRNKREERMTNYGFEEIKILPGNIGYLKFNSFSYDEGAFNVASGVMDLLANADALIIDLRENGGGSPEMFQFLCSYFLNSPRKHLNSFFYKEPDRTTQYWTYTYLPGKRLDKADLYILTSKNTFSGAEEFSYNLKNLKRATVIGETTGGGAHDSKFVILNHNFMMMLPFARAFNPITKTNWEGVGVEPDIKMPANEALQTAQLLAMKKLSEKEEDPKFKKYYSWTYEGYQSQVQPMTVPIDILRSYVGKYGPRTITLEDSSLFYQREGRAKMKMIPISEDYFGFQEIDYFRLKFIKEDNKVIAVEGWTADGPIDRHLKDK
jgi:hypothetical protein